MNKLTKFMLTLGLTMFAGLALSACDDDNATSSTSGFVVGNDG
ncbi:hypothetical protein [Burkholderia sp.]|nr:hypothetical protein [Burkholderia sp.]